VDLRSLAVVLPLARELDVLKPVLKFGGKFKSISLAGNSKSKNWREIQNLKIGGKFKI
jgi:hypothetical protein